MKRNLITILSLVVMSLMFNATSAYAQAFAKADVPFAFNVGSALLPAGTYEVKVLSQSPYEIMIQNYQSNASAVAVARHEGTRDADCKLVFHRIASQYFLTEVWKGSEAGRMIVPTSRHEKELTKELQLAKGPSSSEKVTIALK